jgi:hypothetical protein
MKHFWKTVRELLMKHGAIPAIIIATGIAVTIALRYGH